MHTVVAAQYLFQVDIPFSCAMNPGAKDSSWLTNMHCPGLVMAMLGWIWPYRVAVFHGLLIALP
jgi:hypothetical protein